MTGWDASDFWNFVVDFGDAAILIPAVCAGSVVLLLRRRARPAVVWIAAFLLSAALTAVLKMARNSEIDLFALHFVARSAPSGHTAISLTFYAGIAALLEGALGGIAGRIAALAAVALSLLIAVATVTLEWHPWGDVVYGAGVGSIVGTAAWLGMRARTIRSDGIWAVAAAGLVITALHGARLDVALERPFAQPIQPAESRVAHGPAPSALEIRE